MHGPMCIINYTIMCIIIRDSAAQRFGRSVPERPPAGPGAGGPGAAGLGARRAGPASADSPDGARNATAGGESPATVGRCGV